MAKTIEEYLNEITTLAAGRDLSERWYRDRVKEIVPYRLTESNIISSIRKGDSSIRPIYGLMNLMYYDPKLKESLPYYDVFPLVIPIRKLNDGFIGINFHYLSIPLRLGLLEKLQPLSQEGRRIGWTRVSKFRYIRPCVKRYLATHVKSRFLKIEEEQMQLAAMMPVQRFKKESFRKVHAESRRKR
tara:strand:+ start:205 stop:762 length:558 start_codon:yes stop_codon:yes gene_type:complete